MSVLVSVVLLQFYRCESFCEIVYVCFNLLTTFRSRTLCAIYILLHKRLIDTYGTCYLPYIKLGKLVKHITYGIIPWEPFYYVFVHCC